jgi:peroxiredoxin
MSTIAEQVNDLKAAAAGRLPAEVLSVFAADQAALTAEGIPPGSVKAGDKLSSFALPDATGQTVTLDEITADGPAVLVFYRGGWCPYCNLALRTYESDLLPQLGAYSARLVAISPETPDASLTTQEKDELTYTVLSDSGLQLADALGITFDPSAEGLAAQRSFGLDISATRADGGTRLPMPTVLIVDRDQTVQFVDIHPDYTGRTEVSDVVAALQKLTA